MGEMADYILNGDDCEGCGEYIGEGDGYPRRCAACGSGDAPKHQLPTPLKGIKCPGCDKRVKGLQGLYDHILAKHGNL